MKSRLKVVFLIVSLGAFIAVGGVANAAYVEVGTFAGNGSGPGGSGSEPGQLFNAGQAAVNDATGDLYVADTGNDRIEVFAETPTGGEFLTQLSITEPTGVAVDQSNGDLYVASPSGIAKYDESLTPITLAWTDPGVSGRLAVDPTNGDLLVADEPGNQVLRFDSEGSPVGSFSAERPVDLAVNSLGEIFVVTSTGDITGACGPTSVVKRFSSSGTEEGTVGPSLETPGAVAINTGDDSIVIATHVGEYFCEKGSDPGLAFFDSSGASEESVELGPSTLFAMVPGLAITSSRRVYALTRSPNNDSFGATGIAAFENRPPTPPSIESESASPTETEADLKATINPGRTKTTYRFEYGQSVTYGNSTPSLTIGSELEPESVVAQIRGLTPGVTYHFEVVATNSAGENRSSDRLFTTGEVPMEGGCANEAIRKAQNDTFLGDCRAYEQVSPIEKAGTNIPLASELGTVSTQVASDGNAIFYHATGAFPGAASGLLTTHYIGLRSESGDSWATLPATPPELQAPRQVPRANFGESEDLRKSLVASERALAPGAVEGQPNVYVFDNRTDAYTLVATSADPAFRARGVAAITPIGGSPDFSHVVFETEVPLTQDAARGPNIPNVYDWSGGDLHLVNYLPGGTVDTEGARGGNPVGLLKQTPAARVVAADGRRIFFESAKNASLPAPIYMREDGTTTVPISESHKSGDPAGAQSGFFAGASSKGDIVYFLSPIKLTEDSTAPQEAATYSEAGQLESELYRLDQTTGQLSDLTVDGAPGSVGGDVRHVLGVSEDGSYVYFIARGALTEGATEGEENLYLWHDGALRFIANINFTAELEINAQLSPNGRHLAFASSRQFGDYDNRGPACAANPEGRCIEVYEYNATGEGGTGELVCASCDPGGGQPNGNATLGGVPSGIGIENLVGQQARIPTVVLDDGTVFLDSPDALVGRDSNGEVDAYRYQSGALQLLSTGKWTEESQFLNSSTNGHDVFILTSQPLVRADRDQTVDLYDVRASGGIADQNESSSKSGCTAEECRGESPPAPAAVPATSSTFTESVSGHRKKPHRHKRHPKKVHRKHRGKHGKKKQPHHGHGGAR